MKNIIILSNASGYGGAEKSMELIIDELSKNYKLDVFVENKEHAQNITKNTNIIRLESGKGLKSTFGSLFKILSFLQKNKYDAIIANTNKAAFFLSILSFVGVLQKKRILIFIRDFQWLYQEFIFNSLKKMDPLYLFPSKVFFDSDSFLAKNIKNYTIIPNFTKEVTNLKTAKNDKKIILLPAMISRWKGIENLIKATVILKDSFDLEVQIIGKVIDEKYFNELKILIKDYNIEKDIKFIPFSNDLSIYYNNANLIVNTSLSKFGGPETFGRTIIEAWSYKKPVVAFDCGGPKYIINDGLDGYLVEEGNFAELAQKITKAIINAEVLGENGYKNFKDNYSKEAVIWKLNACLF